MPTFTDACAQEIIALHAFFERWFRGSFDEPTQALVRLSSVLAPGFQIVSPRGVVTEREPLVAELFAAFGAWSRDEPPGTITVESISPRHVHGEVALLTYVERQVRPRGETARLSTVLMQRHDGPHGVRWLHVHETWLPDGSP